jgi:hypothetical protein
VSQGNARFIPDGPHLFDLKADPGETRNLAGQGLPAEKELSDLLVRWMANRRKGAGPQEKDLSEEDKQRLKALGYG